jgi:Protein of unknown function (DUF3450)
LLKKCFSIPLILLGFIAGSIHAQETLSGVQRDLDRVEKEIEKEKDLHKTERKRAAEFETEKAAKLKALQEQIRLTQIKIDSLKRQAETARQKKVMYRSQGMTFQAKQRDFLKALSKQVREMALSLGRDFPYEKDKRVSDLTELAAAIDNGVVNLEDGLNRFFILMQGSLDFAYDTEVYRGSYLATDGSSHEGSYVRMGAVLLAFADENAKIAAYLSKEDSGYVWKDQDLAPETRQDIFTAVKVAQGKVAPQLVNIPFKAPKPVETGK